MIWWLDSMVQIIKCFASLPDKTELHRSQHNKAPYPRWLEYKVPSSAVLQIFGHRDLQINYHVFVFAFSVDKKTKRPFQNPLCLCLRFLFWDSLYGTQHISENSFEGGEKRLTALNMVPPSTGRHTKLNKRKNILIILYHKVKCNISLHMNMYKETLSHTHLFGPHQYFF